MEPLPWVFKIILCLIDSRPLFLQDEMFLVDHDVIWRHTTALSTQFAMLVKNSRKKPWINLSKRRNLAWSVCCRCRGNVKCRRERVDTLSSRVGWMNSSAESFRITEWNRLVKILKKLRGEGLSYLARVLNTACEFMRLFSALPGGGPAKNRMIQPQYCDCRLENSLRLMLSFITFLIRAGFNETKNT